MKTYTVVGFYSDNGQRFCGSFEAKTPEEAEEEALGSVNDDPDNSGKLHICAVFKGDLTPVDSECNLNPPL
jgi:predicted NUDIX family phosphoesterase